MTGEAIVAEALSKRYGDTLPSTRST